MTTTGENMPPDMSEIERRLRDAEDELTEYRITIDNMAKEITKISINIDTVAKASAQIQHLDKLEAKIDAAHKRVDHLNEKFMKVGLEHETCMKVGDMEAKALAAMKDEITSIKNSIQLELIGLKSAVASLTRDEQEIKGWWKARFAQLMDKFFPVLILFALFMVYLHFNGREFTNDNEHDKAQAVLLKSVLDKLEYIERNQIKKNDLIGPPTIDLPKN